MISFNIAIVDDDVVEASEQFSLHLEIPDEAASSGITKGTQYAAANITIVNDDGQWRDYTSLPNYWSQYVCRLEQPALLISSELT